MHIGKIDFRIGVRAAECTVFAVVVFQQNKRIAADVAVAFKARDLRQQGGIVRKLRFLHRGKRLLERKLCRRWRFGTL